MTTYRFIGTESYVGETKMSRFGQRFKIDEELAALAQKGGAALLSDEDFESFGFTDRELKVWADPFMSEHDVPTDEDEAEEKAAFLAKKNKALEKYRAIQHDLLEPHNRVAVDSAPGKVKVLITEVEDAE